MTERWNPDRAAAQLRRPCAADDKYRRGVLGVRTGSARYPGAAVLGVCAAWRTGVGLLRYAPPIEERASEPGLPPPAAAVLAARPETVFGEPGGRPCDAWLIGSGTDPAERPFAEREALLRLLRGPSPAVIDAGALDLVREARSGGGPTAPAILTPHAGEFERLWRDADLDALPGGWAPRPPRAGSEPPPTEAGARRDAALRLAERLAATVLLKGSVTVVATPRGRDFAWGPATPWLASAGTGDVLGGILGALVAARAEEVRADPELLGPLGITAALLHDLAARIASGDEEANGAGRPITALDVAEAIPAAISRL